MASNNNCNNKKGVSDPNSDFNNNFYIGPGYDYEVSVPGIDQTGYNYIPVWWLDPVSFDDSVEFVPRSFTLKNGNVVRWSQRHKIQIYDGAGLLLEERINPLLNITTGLANGFPIQANDLYNPTSTLNFDLTQPLKFRGADGIQVQVINNELVFSNTNTASNQFDVKSTTGDINVAENNGVFDLSINAGQFVNDNNLVRTVNGLPADGSGNVNIAGPNVNAVQTINTAVPGFDFDLTGTGTYEMKLATADTVSFRNYIGGMAKAVNDSTALNNQVLIKDSTSFTGYRFVDVCTLVAACATGGSSVAPGPAASPTAPQSPAVSVGYSQSQFAVPAGNANGSTSYTNGLPMLTWSPSVGATSYTVKEGNNTIATGLTSTSYIFNVIPTTGSHTYSIYAVNGYGQSATALAIGPINVTP